MARDANVADIRSEIDRLNKSRRDIERLIARKSAEILQALPAEYGCSNMDSFIRALAPFASKPLRDQIGSPPAESPGSKKGKRFTAEKRIEAREHLEAGVPDAEVARRIGACPATIARWKLKFGIRTKRSRKRRVATRIAGSDPRNEKRQHSNGQEVRA